MSRTISLIALAISFALMGLAFVALDSLIAPAATASSSALAVGIVGASISAAAFGSLAVTGLLEHLRRRRRDQSATDFEEAPTEPFVVYSGSFAEDSARARAETTRRVVRKALGGMLSLLLIAPLFGGCSHTPNVEPVAAAVVKCVEKDPAELAKLEAQGEALWSKHDIGSIIALALSAGELGSCMFAELTQKHTAPAGDGAAPEPAGDRLQLLKAFEDYRAKHAGGATIRTADGDL